MARPRKSVATTDDCPVPLWLAVTMNAVRIRPRTQPGEAGMRQQAAVDATPAQPALTAYERALASLAESQLIRETATP